METHTISAFEAPTKKIFDASGVADFRRSVAYQKLHVVLQKVIDKIKGEELPRGVLDVSIVTRKPDNNSRIPQLSGPAKPDKDMPVPPAIDSNYDGVLSIIQVLDRYIDETPPSSEPRRFGSLQCRVWHDKVIASMDELLMGSLRVPSLERPQGYFEELKYYLLNSFGSQVRLDYGTGHELSYLAFLGGLFEYGVLDYTTVSPQQMLTLFAKYYDLVRRLILVYSLEPAGSHGVWGLDDHFHLIYILGAAQFNSKGPAPLPVPSVSSVLTSQIINGYKETNLYANAIAFIFRIKSGPFHEHSPIIYDIHCTVHKWAKVLQGLLKMYEVEVLGKFPVMQHFWFGKALYPWVSVDTNEELGVKGDQGHDEPDNRINTVRPPTNTTRPTTNTSRPISMTGAPWANSSRR